MQNLFLRNQLPLSPLDNYATNLIFFGYNDAIVIWS